MKTTTLALLLWLAPIGVFCQGKAYFSGSFKIEKAKQLITKYAKSLQEPDDDDAGHRYDYSLQKAYTVALDDKQYQLVTFSGMPNYCGTGVWGYAVFEKQHTQWTLQQLDNQVAVSEKMREIPEVAVALKGNEVTFSEKGKLPKTIRIATPKAQQEEWIPLFNGKDLSGWDIKIAGYNLNDNYKNTFRVENGMLRIMYDQYQNFDEKYGHIYYKTPFSYYKLRFTYRFQGNQTPGGAVWNNRNSGVMIHSQSAQSLSKGQTFPISLEIQLLGGLGKGTRHTGNLCSPGTQVYMKGNLAMAHCIDSNSKTYDGDQWVQAGAVVLGDSVVHHTIESDTVLTYYKTQIGGGFVSKDYDFAQAHIDNPEEWIKKDGTPLKEGYIALQAESHAIDFKQVEVLNLIGCTNPKALNYKTYYLKSDNSTCRFAKKKR